MNTHTTTTVRLRSGRSITIEQFGTPSAAPVLLLPSAPGSRLIDPDPSTTERLGVRLLVADRPGYGGSDRYPADIVPDWELFADLLAEALQTMGTGPLPLVGWSNGGVAALALAATHPELVSALTIVATPAPDDAVPWVGQEYRRVLQQLRATPESALASLEAMFAATQGAPDDEALLAMVCSGPDDRVLLQDVALRSRLLAMLREAFAQGAAGLAADIVATHVAAWTPQLESVVASVHLYYGATDELVRPAHGEYYRDRLRQAQLRVLPHQGHLTLAASWEQILQPGLAVG